MEPTKLPGDEPKCISSQLKGQRRTIIWDMNGTKQTRTLYNSIKYSFHL